MKEPKHVFCPPRSNLHHTKLRGNKNGSSAQELARAATFGTAMPHCTQAAAWYPSNMRLVSSPRSILRGAPIVSLAAFAAFFWGASSLAAAAPATRPAMAADGAVL